MKLLLAISLSTVVTYAQAQNTVGELLDAGAKKSTKDEMVAAVAGAKITGPTSSGKADTNIDFKADGTFSGYVTSRQAGGTSGSVGKWTVDAKMCVDEYLSAWNMHHKECWFTYRVGEQSYRTLSDSEDRNTKVLKSQNIVKQAN
jgi:hypothetical protein